ncbi:class I SAM-dependent methyltransferase [Ancylobacter sp. WKF20]|uniref:class I SAM-dependent methyltransferase n=1 Tax=Ancylobacter sp. WKF20 TaxID=3039801 RepID=UPI00243416FE|nr:class I SAM-dependent methyltransferase [Ancylobacter sp. WKF20]WGD29217.1 class I SAM-dependent methyltransferase [Ancylobacter sp. WKF20]
MFPDVVDLRSFYAQPLGVVTRRLIGRAIRGRFDNVRGLSVLGIGYATPYLGVFREECERALAFMPGAQGVTRWPSAAPTLAALVHETELPLRDGMIDRVIAVHLLEMTPDAEDVLREVWRVLAPGGRLLCVVPNRRGVWARVDNNPFGHGRPFSRTQITDLLRGALFTPVAWSEALYIPPVQRNWFLRGAVAWERAGASLALPFAAVHIVEATKQVYKPVPLKRRASRLQVLQPVLEPVLSPRPAGRVTPEGF